MRVVIDTNVIIDAFASREPWNEDAENMIMLISQEKLEAVICASAVTDIYYICNKVFHDKAKTRQVVKALFDIFTVTDVRKKDLQDALNLNMDDFEDAVISVCAKRTNCKYIVTRNKDDYNNSPVPAITPRKFLASFDK